MTITIKSIELINFLCHKHLKIDFTKKLTLIGGLNGSGKSAIMIAIGLVLGQRVNTLERGNSCKELIKTGEQLSIIKITLNNSENFLPEVFESLPIVIEKKITFSSLTTRIYSFKKKMWTTKKADLVRLLDFFSLRFDNPLNFLTQEFSKKFLNVSQPHALYEFFMKGTEIEDMKLLHEETKTKAIEMQEKIDTIQKDIMNIQKELKIRKGKIEALQNVETWENEIARMELEKEWAKIDFEGEKVLIAEVKDLKIKLAEAELKITGIKKDLEMTVAKNKAEQEKNTQLYKEISEKNNITQKEINELEQDKHEMRNELKSMNEEIQNMKKQIEENERRKDHTEFDKLECDIENLKQFIEEKKSLKAQYEGQLRMIESEEIKESERIKLLTTQINATKRMIDENKKMKNNQINYFGDETVRMINEMKKIKFKGEVFGPLANYIELKDKKWFRPVSIILKNFLNAYIVFEKEDKEILYNLFRRFGIRNSTIYQPNNKNDVLIKYEKNKNYTTVLDVINCKNNVILNQLIIVGSIEQIILIEDRQQAHKVIASKPYNVDCAYTIIGDQIKMFGNSISDFSKSDRNEKYYFQNSADKIMDLEGKLKELETQNLFNKFTNEKFQLKSKLRDIDVVVDLKEREVKNKEIKHAAFVHTQKKIGDEDIDKIKDSLIVNEAQKNDIYHRILETDQQIKIKKESILNSTKNLEALSNDCKREENHLMEQLLFAQSDHNKIQTQFNNLNYKLENKKASITIEKNKLLTLGEPFQNVRKLNVIEENIFNLKTKIELGKKNFNKQELKEEVDELNMDKEEKESLISEYKDKVTKIFESAQKRIKKREEIKIKESIRATNDFKRYTKMRDYDGHLKFDHDKETLEISIKLKNNEFAGDKSTLSGGERSFAGICLLLSLWPSVCCPVKILDEFDVYMDNLNRKCALETIVRYFVKENVQVILITPLDTNEFFNDTCDVIVLNPPREKNKNN